MATRNSVGEDFQPGTRLRVRSMNTADPSQFISECIAGNEHAIETLVRQYETGVYRLALSTTNDIADANEVTQETFITALRSLRDYREKSSFKAWLYTIAINHSRNHLRKRRSLGRLLASLTQIFQLAARKSPDPEDQLVQNEREQAIWNSLNELDERHRIVVVLRYFHELSIAEIAEILSINEGTVHSRLHNAREKLRTVLAALNKD